MRKKEQKKEKERETRVLSSRVYVPDGSAKKKKEYDRTLDWGG